MAAIAHSPEFAHRVGVPQSVGREFNQADAGTGILSRPHHGLGGAAAGLGHFQGGGETSPWWERQDAYQELRAPSTGFIGSSVAGRTDRIPLSVASDSHVIPADVVSSLGQGNSLAGARIMQLAMPSGPYGTPPPRQVRGRGPPEAPRMPYFEQRNLYGMAAGGNARKPTSVLVAGGEFLVSAEDVERLGGGSLKRGHELLDQMIRRVREHQIKWLKNAPPPKR